MGARRVVGGWVLALLAVSICMLAWCVTGRVAYTRCHSQDTSRQSEAQTNHEECWRAAWEGPHCLENEI